jgi:integrase
MTGEPLKRKSRIKLRSRARDKVVTPEEHGRILEHFDRHTQRWFTGVVRALENTGARLSEIISARVRDWKDDLGAIVYYSDRSRRADDFRHKTAARKDRLILFTGDALEMVRFLVKDRPADAPIFHNKRGGPFGPHGATQYFIRAQKATGLKHVSAHAYRHTFATRWLQRDGNIDALAECLGDTPETIRQTYSHLLKDPAGLRAKLESVMRPCTEIRP